MVQPQKKQLIKEIGDIEPGYEESYFGTYIELYCEEFDMKYLN